MLRGAAALGIAGRGWEAAGQPQAGTGRSIPAAPVPGEEPASGSAIRPARA